MRLTTMFLLAGCGVFLLSAGGCGGDDEPKGTGGKGGGDGGAGAPNTNPMPFDASACGAVMQQHPIEASPHVENCSVVSYSTSPPSSGSHYGSWAAFQNYDIAVPWGFLVHSLEHGAVVVAYNCPGGCDAEVDTAKAWIDTLPADPLCTDPVKRRVILVPDSTLPSRWGAAAWGATLKADCFEAAIFSEFHQKTYAKGPENICPQGTQLVDPDGGSLIPLGCGIAGFDAGGDAGSADASSD